jgi:hypothetical protein
VPDDLSLYELNVRCLGDGPEFHVWVEVRMTVKMGLAG